MKHKIMSPSISGYALLNGMDYEDDDEEAVVGRQQEDYSNNLPQYHDYDTLMNDDSYNNSTLLNNSPTKPLNFPLHKAKEFNSSSDTYTSDAEVGDNDAGEIAKVNNKNGEEKQSDLFDRNFSFDNSEDAIKTVVTLPVKFEAVTTAAAVATPGIITAPQAKDSKSDEESAGNDDAFFQTPLTSTTDLSPEKLINRTNNNSSPSKSIMRKKDTPYGSPTKKSVVFTALNPEIHLYKKEETATEDEYLLQLQLPLDNSWNPVPKSDELSSEDDEEPPAPPPHTENNLKAINENEGEEDPSDDVDTAQLKELRKNGISKSSSNLSLNEKLDIFLSKKHYNNKNIASNDVKENDVLDKHLNQLESSKSKQLDSSIRNLSFKLQTEELEGIENPLNSFSRSGDVDIMSGNTSRSSMQSLRDEDRVLESSNVNTVAKSIELNDGIKGFSDHMVESLLPESEEYKENNSNMNVTKDVVFALPMIGSLGRQFVDSSNDEFHDSFDQSYNNTEQSIMDLLKRQSSIKGQSQVEETAIKAEPVDNIVIKSEDPTEKIPIKQEIEDDPSPIIKDEPTDNSYHIPIKDEEGVVPLERNEEAENEVNSISEKRNRDLGTSKMSILPDLRRDLEHIHNHPTEIASVSGFGIPHDSSRNQVVRTPVLTTSKAFQEDLFDSAHEQSHQFSLRDHIDSDWKFEDSNDGDREDNDELTNNEITRETILQNENNEGISENENLGINGNNLKEEDTSHNLEQDKEKEASSFVLDQYDEKHEKHEKQEEVYLPTKRERLLEIDLSPDISRQISREESVKSLAPPKIDSPIKSPVRSFTFERNASQNNSPIKPGRVQVLDQQKEVELEKKFEPRELFKDFDKEENTIDDSVNKTSSSVKNVSSEKTLENGTEKENEKRANDRSNDEVQQSETLKNNVSHEDYEALANSSNIAPNEDITLPPVDLVSHQFSIAEITKNMENNLSLSFEESLSAEHDQDPASPANFISIWHSQDRHIKAKQPNDNYTAYEVLQQKVKLPSSLQPKTFKEVNVITRRIVSPGYEDLNVSGFLPELSQDSGFEKQFKGIVKSRDNTNESNSFNDSTQEIETNGRLLPKSLTKSNQESLNDNSEDSIKVQKSRLRPPKANFKPVVVKRSQFKVPSFEIKRGNSVLSPRNQYDDIYNDTIKPRKYLPPQSTEDRAAEVQQVLDEPPTIKSSGMKTLPSMDRNDVQKILNTKRIISQEEYSKLKLLGNTKKESLILQEDKYDHLQQHASIHDAHEEDDDDDLSGNTTYISKSLPTGATPTHRAVVSTPTNGGRAVEVDNSILPHLADELLRVPSALLSKDQFFKESEFSSPVRVNDAIDTSSEASSRVSSVIHTKKPQTLAPKHVISQHFPEPDPELCHDIFKTPPKELDSTLNSTEDEQAQQRLLAYDGSKEKRKNRSYHHSSTPIKSKPGSKGNSPIKIGSPILIVKDKVNGGVTAVPSPKKSQFRDEVSFTGNDLSFDKLRESPQKRINDLQTVNVPSQSSNNTDSTSSSSAILMAAGKEKRKISGQLLTTVISSSRRKPLSERGRLFLRVVGLKNLDLPDLRNRNAEFTMTLDNGVHCIKTPSYSLNDRNISIGKEFELTVGQTGLEFILTMKATYEKPKGGLKEVHERKVVKSKNRLSRLLGSKEIVHTTKFVPIEVVDTWENKFAQDGSFARCYVDLDQYEGKITGKVCNFDVTCFNEWATVNDSKGEQIKCKPYRIGQLEVKMLFIPKSVHEEVLPSSIKSAYESVNSLKHELSLSFEGYLHQEGGDCDVWKRRFFKLEGTSLIAHSEYTHKTRAKINLAKVVEVIYIDKENSKTQSNYRNFSEVLLLEHAFKIKFGNGETIDFGAPNNVEKMQWISILEKIIQRNKFRVQPWVKIMLECNNIKQSV